MHSFSKSLIGKQKGFTLMELVVVILIVSILSVTAISRFSGSSTHTPRTAQAQAISIIRQIQTGRMQSIVQPADGTQSNYILLITNNCLGSQNACNNPTNEALSARVNVDSNQMIYTTEIINSPSALGSNLPFTFDLLGRPNHLCEITNGVTNCTGQIQITIQDTKDLNSQALVCINSQGFVYQPRLGDNGCVR